MMNPSHAGEIGSDFFSRSIPWLRELIDFVDLATGDSKASAKIVEDAMIRFSESERSIVHDKHLAFAFATGACLDWLQSSPSSSNGQMELFAFDAPSSFLLAEMKQKIVFARLRAWFGRKTMQGDASDQWSRNDHGNLSTEEVLEANDLLAEESRHSNFFEPAEIDQETSVRLIDYCLGIASDEEAISVEKKCRENPDWQSGKVRFFRLVKLMEEALGILPSVKSSLAEEREKQTLRKIEALLCNASSLKRRPPETKLPLNERSTEPQAVAPHESRDRCLLALLASAAFLFMVAFFGWQEREGGVAASARNSSIDPFEQKEPLLNEDWSAIAGVFAQEQAERILAGRTADEIRRMAPMLEEFPESLGSPSESGAPGLRNEKPDWTKLIEDDSEAFLFVPLGESLGRVRLLDAADDYLFFERSKRMDPDQVFSLAPGDYEIRVDRKGEESTVFLGRTESWVKDDFAFNASASMSPRYRMNVRQAWVLDKNQTRRALSLRLPDGSYSSPY